MSETTENLLLCEPWISLAQAAKVFPPARSGRPVSASCLWRWAKEGVRIPSGRRVHLEALLIVSRFVTSEQAVRRFILAIQPGESDRPQTSPEGETFRFRKERTSSAPLRDPDLHPVPVPDLPEGFEEFWDRWPQKIGKKEAIRFWIALAPSPEVREEIDRNLVLRLIDGYWEKPENHDQDNFIAACYLRDRKWEETTVGRMNPATI